MTEYHQQLRKAIMHGKGDQALHVLRREDKSVQLHDRQLEAMTYAVDTLNKDLLLKVIRQSSRSRWVFKEKFIQQRWMNNCCKLAAQQDGEIVWIFHTLYMRGEKDLAMYVATNSDCKPHLLVDFCRYEMDSFHSENLVTKKKMLRSALTMLHGFDQNCYREIMKNAYARFMAYCPFLFSHAVEMGDDKLVDSLCCFGFDWKEVMCALPHLLRCQNWKVLSVICSYVDHDKRYGRWLRQHCLNYMLSEHFDSDKFFQWINSAHMEEYDYYLNVHYFNFEWRFFETIVCTETLLKPSPVLAYRAILVAFIKPSVRSISAAVGLAKLCRMTVEVFDFFLEYPLTKRLAMACHHQGLWDWALLLTPEIKYMEENLEKSTNPIIYKRCFRMLAVNGNWQRIKTLLPKCSDTGVLKCVLRPAFRDARSDIAELVFCQLDPSTLTYVDKDKATLLDEALWLHYCTDHKEAARNLIRLCIASGLPTYMRPLTVRSDVEPLLIFKPSLRFLKLLVESGCCSNKMLHELRKCPVIQSKRVSCSNDSEIQQCSSYIDKTAATPCRLEHLARLAVSHNLGCHPGRTERIQALPLPSPLKDYLRFRDVLADDTLFGKEKAESL